MTGDKDKTTRVEGSQVGVVGDGATIEGGVQFGDTIHKNVITIQNLTVYRSFSPPSDEAPETPQAGIGPNPYLGRRGRG